MSPRQVLLYINPYHMFIFFQQKEAKEGKKDKDKDSDKEDEEGN